MPIVGRTPHECFNTFSSHLRGLVAATVTTRYPLQAVPTATKMVISFREEQPLAIPVETRFGRLHFYLGQALEALPLGGGDGYRLSTMQYWYRLQESSSRKDQALVRWEYDATTERDRHARHHTQMAATLPVAGDTLDLNKAHLPTGWVTIEEVIRFLIVDLGHAPPCGEEWPQVLDASEKKFFEDFTSKRYRPDA
jgi:hypothetical protein